MKKFETLKCSSKDEKIRDEPDELIHSEVWYYAFSIETNIYSSYENESWKALHEAIKTGNAKTYFLWFLVLHLCFVSTCK